MLPILSKQVVVLLLPSRSHLDFQRFVEEQTKIHYLKTGHLHIALQYQRELAAVWCADLTRVASIVGHRYSSERGRPAFDPVNMFRSLLLMELSRVYSIDKWVHFLKAHPLHAIFCGFMPSQIPGVATFYDFLSRLWLAASARLSKQVRKSRQKPKRGKKKGDKSPLKRPGIVARLVKRFIANPPSFGSRPHDLFGRIFKECFVLPSAQMGLLGDVNRLALAGDGTPLRTGASPYGKRVCSCKEKGIYSCSCLRRFPDPDADWGWDSYREEFFFGRSLYAFTAADSPHDLPVYLHLNKASRHDSVLWVHSFFDFLQQYPQFSVSECVLDSAHDAYAIYELLDRHQVSAVIDLNKRTVGLVKSDRAQDISFAADGTPLCPAAYPMVYNGFDKSRQRHKWRCPLRKKRNPVSCDRSCSPSTYGRVVYTYEKDNLRLFTRIPRGSVLWRVRYKRRTAAERFNKRLKIDYSVDSIAPARNSRDWTFRVFTTAMCLHIDAWVAQAKVDARKLLLSWQYDLDAVAA